ncbi:speckle-type POZ protein-like [Trichogramma pretiosum]|uniref:speckle-type POZ protein-like n=1 Tax=Trichogramma pretiosum TaxID=7493 RepID=UPI0006C9880D|nr:speckle-type POZ protein-like [Trichogramma pretiosum]
MSNDKKIIGYSDISTITIQYELTIDTGNAQNFLNLESDNTNKVLVLKCNFNWLFLNKNFSDVILKTACEKEIPAHTGVLSIASSVFKDMFNRNMLENRSKSVNLIDVSYEAAVESLRYIYTGVVETQEFSLTSELLTAADEYQIEELKNECEEILSSSLSIENVVKARKIADKCSVKHLKKEAVDFIKRNISGPLDYDDISNMILVELLRYIYTGGVETREVSLVIDLLTAADKYQVNELKNKCEELLNSNLSTENALEILKIADKYDMKSFKKIATDFIKLHIIGPSNSDDLGSKNQTSVKSVFTFLDGLEGFQLNDDLIATGSQV